MDFVILNLKYSWRFEIMRVQVYFQKWLLGELQEVKGKLVYNSNTEGEKEFFDKSLSTQFYNLYNSENKVLRELPVVLNKFLEMSNIKLYRHMFGLDNTSSDYVKLYSIGTLSLDDDDFYIKSLK